MSGQQLALDAQPERETTLTPPGPRIGHRTYAIEVPADEPADWRCECGFLNTGAQRVCGHDGLRARPDLREPAPPAPPARGPIVRYVDRSHGRCNTRAGYLIRTKRTGRLVLDVPELGRHVDVSPEQVIS